MRCRATSLKRENMQRFAKNAEIAVPATHRFTQETQEYNMQIMGILKMTLLDYPNKIAATVFTSGCNMRCPFCHNPKLVFGEVKTPAISNEAFFAFLKTREHVLDGVCITGGEPTIQPDLEDFIRRIKEFDLLVKLDTNGTSPQKVRRLIDQGLIDYVAMDIKNSPRKYAPTMDACEKLLVPIRESVELLMNSNIDYEFRTTVVQEFHQEEDFHEIGAWLKGARAYYLQNFRDSGDILRPGLHSVSEEALHRFLNVIKQYIEHASIRG